MSALSMSRTLMEGATSAGTFQVVSAFLGCPYPSFWTDGRGPTCKAQCEGKTYCSTRMNFQILLTPLLSGVDIDEVFFGVDCVGGGLGIASQTQSVQDLERADGEGVIVEVILRRLVRHCERLFRLRQAGCSCSGSALAGVVVSDWDCLLYCCRCHLVRRYRHSKGGGVSELYPHLWHLRRQRSKVVLLALDQHSLRPSVKIRIH